MTNLARITSEYVVAEDRIRICGIDENKKTLTLWLTQRLSNRLVSLLCSGLEKHQQQHSGHSYQTLRSHVEHSFAQQQAVASLSTEQGPVVAAADAPHWRVEVVDVAQGAGGVSLTFKGVHESERALLVLPTPALRQWLTIVFVQYRRGGWSTQVWPAWMEESLAGQKAPARALH